MLIAVYLLAGLRNHLWLIVDIEDCFDVATACYLKKRIYSVGVINFLLLLRAKFFVLHLEIAFTFING
jgi:hypothetical protein